MVILIHTASVCFLDHVNDNELLIRNLAVERMPYLSWQTY